jgi:hypothetical protein
MCIPPVRNRNYVWQLYRSTGRASKHAFVANEWRHSELALPQLPERCRLAPAWLRERVREEHRKAILPPLGVFLPDEGRHAGAEARE